MKDTEGLFGEAATPLACFAFVLVGTVLVVIGIMAITWLVLR